MHRSGAQDKKEITALKKRSTRPAPRKFHIFSGSITITNNKHCIMAPPAPAQTSFFKVPKFILHASLNLIITKHQAPVDTGHHHQHPIPRRHRFRGQHRPGIT
ncbi:hypothetical protein TYRP_012288 [Tyrophagus putrescentiae]|nr:hypothetical protein TYRP_022533 [Tyrophagus putrescentiae]KAH9407469.1 hypothetical protein TYRP_012288 [Tyrophagus putrescentiae]